MKHSDTRKGRHGRWGVQVLVVFAFGLILASIGWFGGEQYGHVVDGPEMQADFREGSMNPTSPDGSTQ